MTDDTESDGYEVEQLQSELTRVRMQLVGAIAECRETARVLGALDIETSVTAADRVMAHVIKIETALKALVERVDVTPAKKFETLVQRLRDIGELPSVLASGHPYPSTKVVAPWTDDQVASLNAYQMAGTMHPFTYGEGPEQVDLLATPDGWVAVEGGPVVQRWAHGFMVDGSWRGPEDDFTPAPHFTLDVPLGEPALWRVGKRVRRNIYRGDEPIAMVATPEIAAEIVVGMNLYEHHTR